ncbi:MAG: response regulator [Candidatus Omnitrophica bacterium]|jgi:two-component system alkaline phosphatase synthesis response regulator PhoP|nr:response regulator [Candidatus Omnitrophota bacterium]
MAKKIVVVDDEPDVLKVEVFRLKKMGYEVYVAVNGKEGLELIREKKPDLVLLDLRLPVMEGTEVCIQMKADEGLRGIPVILVTASSDCVVEKVKLCKADDYMLKPFDSAEMAAKIVKFLG